MRSADRDLLARLDQLYGRAFLRRLVQMGDRALRLNGHSRPAPEILASVRSGGLGLLIGTAVADVKGVDRAGRL